MEKPVWFEPKFTPSDETTFTDMLKRGGVRYERKVLSGPFVNIVVWDLAFSFKDGQFTGVLVMDTDEWSRLK